MDKPATTILDVIDNFGGGAGITEKRAASMTLAEIDEFAEMVNSFYELWEPSGTGDSLTVYPGGVVGGLTTDREPSLNHLFSSLLYYPRAVVHDPLSSWFNRDKERLRIREALPPFKGGGIWPSVSEFDMGMGMGSYWTSRADLSETRLGLGSMLKIIETLRPLIKEGYVDLVPQWRIIRERQMSIATALRFDTRNAEMWELISRSGEGFSYMDLGGKISKMEFDGPMVAESRRRLDVEGPAFYLNKMISIADYTNAIYVPPFDGDYKLLKLRIDRVQKDLRMKSSLEPRIIHDLTQLDLPAFRDVTAKNLVKARQNEDAFETFRVKLNNEFSVAIGAADDEVLFPIQIAEHIKDAMMVEIRAVEKATSASATLKGALEDSRRALVVGAATGTATLAVGGSGAAVAATMTTSMIATAIYRMIFRPKLEGSKLVISALIDK